MQNVMRIATDAGHTGQNDGQTMQNDGRPCLPRTKGGEGLRSPQGTPLPLYLKKL